MPRTNRIVLAAAVGGLTFLGACASFGSRRPAQVTPANVALGDSLFHSAGCARCHGKGGVGAANAPALDGKKWLQLKSGNYDEIVQIITTGVPQTAIKDASHRFGMRARGGPANLTDTQVQAVAAYVWTLSHKK